MSLKSLTYTSLASLDLTSSDLEDIHRVARSSNAFQGISGLLIFNGVHFLQVIEGPPEAIDELVERLRRDPRHQGFEVRDEREASERSFPSWTMELVRVSSTYFEARETVAHRLPPTTSREVRDRIIRMTETISGTVVI